MNQDTLSFIKKCIRHRRIIWTNHVDIRLKERLISRHNILSSVAEYEIIDEYPDNIFLPSYLIYSKMGNKVFHILINVDFQNELITIVTSYQPTQDRWERDYRTRKKNELLQLLQLQQ